MTNRSATVVPALLIALGLVGAGAFIAHGFAEFRKSGRHVTVKGLVERDVASDLALWPLKVKVAGNDLASAQQEMEASVAKIAAFLKTNGFTDEEISTQGLRVFDRRTQEYNEMRADQLRYIVEITVSVRTGNVAQVSKVSQMTSELVKSGVTLAEDNSCFSGPTYLFTKLNDIKPEMLAEATKNARTSAEQFAIDSGSRVGQIMQANQGTFSITSRDNINESGEGGGCGVSDPYKKVRVVTTVDYYLEG